MESKIFFFFLFFFILLDQNNGLIGSWINMSRKLDNIATIYFIELMKEISIAVYAFDL